MNGIPQHIILFDGVCNLCNGVVAFLIQRDKKEKFSFASLQSAVGQELLGKLGLPLTDFHSFVYMRGDKFYTRSSAWLYVLKDLGSVWQLFFALILVPKPIRDFFYNFISKDRYGFFGKKAQCMVPIPAWKTRFLD